MDENLDVIKVYNEVWGQFIMGPNGAIDINTESIYRAMDELGIDDINRHDVKDRTRKLVLYMLNKQREKDQDGNQSLHAFRRDQG